VIDPEGSITSSGYEQIVQFVLRVSTLCISASTDEGKEGIDTPDARLLKHVDNRIEMIVRLGCFSAFGDLLPEGCCAFG
jgi:hypothetical protein